MVWLGFSLVIQLICYLHAHKNGKDRVWTLVILLFSLPGCFAYFVFEVMPGLIGPGSDFARKKRVEAAADPVAALGRAETELAKVDTVANQLAVAEAYMGMAAYASATEHFQLALERMHGSDEGIETRLAAALFENARFDAALAALDAIERSEGKKEGDCIAYLRARILEGLGQGDAARARYAEIVPRLRDPEVRCRYAALLLQQGDIARAREELIEVEKQAPGLGRIERERHAEMLDWAKRELAGIEAPSL
jgi:hypothetical protein